jgi:hypothetical protein
VQYSYSILKFCKGLQARRGFEPRSTDSESVVLTATPTSPWGPIGRRVGKQIILCLRWKVKIELFGCCVVFAFILVDLRVLTTDWVCYRES